MSGTATVSGRLTTEPGTILAASSSESGGGGSEDFSTRTVTITNTQQDANIDFYSPIVSNNDIAPSVGAISSVSIEPKDTADVPVILYKGVAYAYFVDEVTIQTTGDIVNNDGDLTITGDGTITISAK